MKFNFGKIGSDEDDDGVCESNGGKKLHGDFSTIILFMKK